MALPARHSWKWQPSTTFQLPVMYSSHALPVMYFSQTSCELLAKCTDFQLSLSLHQLNTKLNTIKSHKIQGNKLKQLQYFLSWNKVNIKHSYRSQLYNSLLSMFFLFLFYFLILMSGPPLSLRTLSSYTPPSFTSWPLIFTKLISPHDTYLFLHLKKVVEGVCLAMTYTI